MFLEIIGITLAYIEIRYKPLANRIEGKILKEEARIRNFASRLNDNKLFVTLATIFFVLVFFLDIPYLVGFFDRIVPEKWMGTLMIAIRLTVPIIVFFAAGVLFLPQWMNAAAILLVAVGVIDLAVAIFDIAFRRIRQ